MTLGERHESSDGEANGRGGGGLISIAGDEGDVPSVHESRTFLDGHCEMHPIQRPEPVAEDQRAGGGQDDLGPKGQEGEGRRRRSRRRSARAAVATSVDVHRPQLRARRSPSPPERSRSSPPGAHPPARARAARRDPARGRSRRAGWRSYPRRGASPPSSLGSKRSRCGPAYSPCSRDRGLARGRPPRLPRRHQQTRGVRPGPDGRSLVLDGEPGREQVGDQGIHGPAPPPRLAPSALDGAAHRSEQ